MEILVRDIINKAQNTLEAAGIADSQVDSWLLAEFVFGITRAKYYANMQMTVDGKSAEKYNELVNQRAGHIPLQHLVGTQEFMGLTFKVNENVLIPRQDTELLVENVADCLGNGERTVLDMCTGSGCIAVSIDRLSKDSKVTAVDISEKALEVAQENNRFNNANVTFIQSDLFTNACSATAASAASSSVIPALVNCSLAFITASCFGSNTASNRLITNIGNIIFL